MNIFVLSLNPVKCAKQHNDKHVVKMILESWQLLDTALKFNDNVPCAWINHPCAKWVRKSKANFKWLCELGLELCKEYSRRYSGKIHKYDQLNYFRQSLSRLDTLNFPDKKITKFYLAMPEDVKCESTIKSYRNYYIHYKQHLAQWKDTKTPRWFVYLPKTEWRQHA